MDSMARMSRLRRLLVLLFSISFIAIGIVSLLLRFGPEENRLPAIPKIPNIPIINPRPSVTLRQGSYLGEISKQEPQSIEQFLGIPYALSTGGERRFRPPVPVPASTESFDASEYGFMCPNGLGGGIYARDEDCLNLNVYRPKVRASDKKLPVLVDVHGGAFNFGSGKDKPMGNMIAWSEEPFIGVTFNYRLGAFGFLPSKLTEKEGLLNLGLKDQWLLFEWVRDNIAEFGGDPDDVTLTGQSAGGHSVSQR
jgi:acetylcholinesterase